jgi:NADH-quinone oxidoreductase subunit F
MKTVCVLSAACTMPVRSYLDKFRPEFEAYIAKAGSSAPAVQQE